MTKSISHTSNQSPTKKTFKSTKKLSKNFQKPSKTKILHKTQSLPHSTVLASNVGITQSQSPTQPTPPPLPKDKNLLYNRIGLTSAPSTSLLVYKQHQDKYVDKIRRAAKLSNVDIVMFSDKILRKAKDGEPNKDNIQFKYAMKNPDYNAIPAEEVTGTTVQVPLRVGFREENLSCDKNAVTALLMVSNLCKSELEALISTYGDDLTYGELAAIDLVRDAVENKDPQAIKMFWEIQTKVASRAKVGNQINIAVTSPNSIMTNLLDEITNNITNASEATVVHESQDVPPVTI